MRKFFGTVLLVGTYVAAMNLPVGVIDSGDRESPIPGLMAFQEGIKWPGTICWLANVTLIFGVAAYCFADPKIARGFGVAGTVLSLTAPLVYKISISELMIGYWMWVACSVALGLLSQWEIRDSALRGSQPALY